MRKQFNATCKFDDCLYFKILLRCLMPSQQYTLRKIITLPLVDSVFLIDNQIMTKQNAWLCIFIFD